jgi:hypothetical protein
MLAPSLTAVNAWRGRYRVALEKCSELLSNDMQHRRARAQSRSMGRNYDYTHGYAITKYTPPYTNRLDRIFRSMPP